MHAHTGTAIVRLRWIMLLFLAHLVWSGPMPAWALIGPAEGKVTGDADYGVLPLLFIPNQGQFDSRVVYAVQGRDKSIFFTEQGLTVVLTDKPVAASARKDDRLRRIGSPEPVAYTPKKRWALKLDFVDANPQARPETLEPADTLISYFKGRPEEWRTGLRASRRIIYRNLWPGIDLIYSGTVNRLKYDFIVHPGADPDRIRLAWRGADSVQVTEEGQLAVFTPLGTLRDEMPKAWQEDKGRRESVTVAYGLQAPAGVQVASLATNGLLAGTNPHERAHIVGFTVGDYDRSRALVLDPEMLVYCGFIGGSASEYGAAIAVDSNGSAYVTGETSSPQASFPETVGPDLTYNGGEDDAFVAKLRADGTGLFYCGFIGGTGRDPGYAIAVDNGGNAYITGSTYSTDGSFPVTGGLDPTHNGGNDAFVAKVRADGTSLVYCGFIGGKAPDYGFGIAVDSGGNAYVAGSTDSADGSFPVIGGLDSTHNGGTRDAFVVKVRADGTSLIYCGFIGGTGYDQGNGIAVDSSGSAYVTGSTDSSAGGAGALGFPVTIGPDLTQNGSNDAFVAKVRADGTGLVYCGFIGGTGIDGGQGVAVDSDRNAYVTGYTTSTATSFPETVGPDLSHNGDFDAFVAKVRADGTALTYCGFIGGSGEEFGPSSGIAVDSSGNAYVTGHTTSTETSFPVIVGPDLSYNGGERDAFVAKVQTDGKGLAYCGYIGGAGGEGGTGIAVDRAGDAYVTGWTVSTETSFPVTVGPDVSANGGGDAFVAKVTTQEFPWPIFLPAILEGGKKE